MEASVEPRIPTRVMTFNIRCDVARDGENRWDLRKAMLVDVIRANDPDLIGLQEVLCHQGDYLEERLSGYTRVGTCREDNARQGEAAAIFFRTDRYDLISSGQRWLSPTPDVVNSMGWDAACTRIVTWTVLRDRRDGKSLVFANTHFDHEGELARTESAKLVQTLLSEIAQQNNTDAVILAGDFNCTESSAAYTKLTLELSPLPLADGYRIVHPTVAKDELSFNGFHGDREGLRIDWILNSPALTPTKAWIDRTERGGRYPSDHYPVVIDLTR